MKVPKNHFVGFFEVIPHLNVQSKLVIIPKKRKLKNAFKNHSISMVS
jgi:hypothetical protein